MAKYDYQCKPCHMSVEVERSIHEEESPVYCPDCREPMARVYNNVGVVLKGGGFYKNDKNPQTSTFYPENGSTL